MGIRLGALTLVAALGAGLCASLGAGAASAAGLCSDSTIWLRGDFGKARFSIDVADDPAERAQGLMYVQSMPRSRGMLFVYETAAPVSFWMKNTLIPLDMIFADESGTVVKVHENAVPGDLTSIPGKGDVMFVLEINGGLARQMGISPGSEMRHPAISDASWPCE